MTLRRAPRMRPGSARHIGVRGQRFCFVVAHDALIPRFLASVTVLRRACNRIVEPFPSGSHQRRRPDISLAGAGPSAGTSGVFGAGLRPLEEVIPAVTCSAQASLLTGSATRAARDRRQWLALSRDRARFGSGSSRTRCSRPSRSTRRRVDSPRSMAERSGRPSSSGGSTRGPTSTPA